MCFSKYSSKTMPNIAKNLEYVKTKIQEHADQYGRSPRSIRLLAVSKRKSAEDVRLAYQCGQTEFGENFLQEAQHKIQALKDLDIGWHFIGAVQSNKTKAIAELFDWVHCIDRIKIARRLSEQRSGHAKPLNVCIQVNLDQEHTKAGIAVEAVPELAQTIQPLPGLKLRGLMSIPAPSHSLATQRAGFARMAEALVALQRQGIDCDTLSMGMTQDMEAAIAEGSTIVRIGTAIFGERV